MGQICWLQETSCCTSSSGSPSVHVLFQSRCHPSWSSFAAGFGTSAGIEHVQPPPGKGCARMPACCSSTTSFRQATNSWSCKQRRCSWNRYLGPDPKLTTWKIRNSQVMRNTWRLCKQHGLLLGSPKGENDDLRHKICTGRVGWSVLSTLCPCKGY